MRYDAALRCEDRALTEEPTAEPFEAPERRPEDLVLDLEGFEGPLDVLLSLARDQKVDLRRISILRLAEQYLEFIAAARRVRLEIAADYLVMAAWLAYLKSRLLLPEPPAEEGPSADELASRLTRQLERLEAMRDVAGRLMARHRVGQDVFFRGAPEGIRLVRHSIYDLSLVELLKAYANHKTSKAQVQPLKLRRGMVWSVEDALSRLISLVGSLPDWSTLQAYLPPDIQDAFTTRSAIASTLIASLEMTRQGRLELNQPSAFGPIYLKRKLAEPEEGPV